MRDIDLYKATPGSELAISHGCRCSEIVNNYGKGMKGYGPDCFYINKNCEVHKELKNDNTL